MSAETPGSFITERINGNIYIVCMVCAAARVAPDKGIGRADIATWKTRHQHTGETS
jgi:hypothetical protein